MRSFLFALLGCTVRALLSLRYRIHVKGLDQLSSLNKEKGILFFPNHPAHIDPIVVICLLGRRFLPRPIVVEYIYRKPFVQFFMKLIRAIPIPNFETALNEIKIQKAEKILEKMAEGLQAKEKYILYPSGRLKYTGKEVLGATSLAQSLIQKCPDVQIVMVRTTGLWGSSFSKAYLGRSPDFVDTLFWSMKKLLKNGIFFIPRRDLYLDFVIAKEDFPRKGSRLEVNRYLEKFFNQYPSAEGIVETEPLKRVSYCFWKNELLTPLIREKKKKNIAEEAFSTPVGQEIYKELKRKFPDVEILLDQELSADLGMDSLDIAEIIIFLSVHYDVGELHPGDLETVHDLIDLAEGRKKGEKKSIEEKQFTWPEEKKRKEPTSPMGKTLPEAFLLICDRMKNSYACADDMIGVLTYKKLKMSALVLSREIAKLPGEKIGILLPSSVAAYLVIIATYFANKTPVMLNWTLGPKYLKDMTDLTQVNSILTSWRFLERLGNVSFGDVSEKFILLEDLKKTIPLSEKLFGYFTSFLPAKSVMKALGIQHQKEEDVAVVLFTSGTEASPKGVPLSHKNILSNQTAVLKYIDLFSHDLFYGVLPPFHSFGFAVTGLLPLLAGVKVVFAPDPTDSFALAEGIFRWKITLFCSAPSFLRGLFQAASVSDFATIRLFVAGAEKAPQDLFDKVHQMNKMLIEGYGITEC
ncbi:MAG: AMP-binding protein, partial [Chlamydiota bacterium]